jgi:uncharacterized protein
MYDVVLVVNGTRLCNLRCAYCNWWRTGPDQTMSFAVLARLVANALAPDHATAVFNWHGGETTLLPISFYEKALWLQARFRQPGQVVRNTFQTNGTRLTPEWAKFLRTSQFEVGLSLDGPPEIHDRYRRDAKGGPTFAQVQRGMALLREFDVPLAVTMVIDEAGLAAGPERVFDFFLEQCVSEYALNFVWPEARPAAAPGTPADHYVDSERMSAFLIGLYDRWRAHGDPQVRIRELDALRHSLAGRSAGVCTLSGICLGVAFRVEPNGDIGQCDYFQGDPEYTWGNVLTHDFAALRRSAKLLARQAEQQQALQSLSACPNFAVCHGGCPFERYASRRHNPRHPDGCCGQRDLIDHIRAREAEPTAPRVAAALPASALGRPIPIRLELDVQRLTRYARA